MTIDICDFNGRKKNVEVDVDKLDVAMVLNVSGDMVLYLINRDGTEHWLDASDTRWHNTFDGITLVYHRGSGINRLAELSKIENVWDLEDQIQEVEK